MKFFNSRIVTKTVQIGDALKAESKPRKLDEILADIQQKGQVKTASSSAQVKTASTETETKVEPKAEVKAEVKAEAKTEVKEAKKLPPEFLENIKGKGKGKEEKKDDKEDKGEKKDKKEDKKDKGEKDAKCASAPRTLKMASSLDFRQWEAEDVVRAWGQHGTHEKCMANVKDLVNEPATYCKLLQVASDKAASIVKTASSKEAAKKQASPKGVFKKLAKLSDEEASFLKEYWRNLYGDAYVESMLKDY